MIPGRPYWQASTSRTHPAMTSRGISREHTARSTAPPGRSRHRPAPVAWQHYFTRARRIISTQSMAVPLMNITAVR